MGQHASNFELASEARRAAERFDECEIKVIKETFKDLCHLNGGSMRIDKETFLQYLPLPGLLGERLFAVFDKKCSGEIDYEEFVCGLAVTCRGSWDEKVEFIFNIYDMHGQGAVNREELAALLNHVPKSIMRFGRAMSLESADPHHNRHHNRYHPNQSNSNNGGGGRGDHAGARQDGRLQHHHPHRENSRPHAQPPQEQHRQNQHPPPSSTGTVSGRCSPDRSSAATGSGGMALGSGSSGAAVAATVAVAAAAGAGGKATANGVVVTLGGLASPPPGESETEAEPDLEQGEAAGGVRGVGGGAERESGGPPLLTSGNLMQLHLASLSPKGETSSGVSTGKAAKVAAVVAAVDLATATASATTPAKATATATAAATTTPAKVVAGGSRPVPPGSDDGASPTASAVSAPSVSASVGAATEDPHGAREVAAVAEGTVDASRDVRGGEEGEGNGVGAGGGGGITPSAMEVGGLVGGGAGKRRNTLHSDASTDDGTSAAAHPHYAHWEEFTNNDIVDQAFEDCDLNHNGKLSFSEFRLWVERNPIVTQFLQSVFPYDEHREWGDDRKHLPFIHNREFTGSPMLSDQSGDGDSSDDETRRLLTKARNTTRDSLLRDGIDRLLEQAAGGRDSGSGADGIRIMVGSANGISSAEGPAENGDMPRGESNGRSSMGNFVGALGLMSELSPRSAKVLQHQTVAKQGFLWKQGHRLRTWKQRWYVLVGNCIYYYHYEDDVYPCGVMFMTGSFVEPLQEGANERKGFWGIEISRSNEQNHRRRWYTRSKVEQIKWVKELRKASAVVPIEDDFEIGEELGQGRFSRVCMCVNKHTLERKAVKIIMKEDMRAEEKDLLRAEIAIMKLVNHPNIIRMEAVYESKKDIFIVMELHSGGELFDRIVGRPRFTEDEAFTVIEPLVESVAYLHEMGIVHRDLKPENILCGNRIGDIKIADFGLSKMVMPDEIMKMPCGTLTYVAPEVLTLNGYGKEADIWSVGTIMYLLLRGRLPFDGETREEIIENTIHGAIAWQNDHVWAGFSNDGKDLVLGMLNKDVTRRYKAKDVLLHPWMKSRQKRREENPDLFEF